MTLSAERRDDLLTALAAEPEFVRLAEPATPVFVWRAMSDVPLWASEGGEALLSRLPTAFDGSPRLPTSTAVRLRGLAGGLAPRAGFRLERLRWGRLEAPLVFAARLVSVANEDLLVIALLPPGARRPRSWPARDSSDDDVANAQIGLAPAPTSKPRGRRFAWRADADGRISFVSPELTEVVGARGADVVGWRWQDIVGRLVDDPDDLVGAAWSNGEGWTRRPVGWRDLDGDRVVPVELTGAPVAAGGGRGAGYRGFGLAYPDRSKAVRPGAFAEPPSRPELPPESEPAIAAASHPTSTSVGVIDATTFLGAKPGEAMFNMLRVWLGPTGENAAEEPPAVASVETEEAPAEALTSAEQGALDEIARALRNPDVNGAEAPPERHSAEIVQHPRARLRAEPAMLLDQLSLSAFVLRDGVPIFANREALRKLGFASLPEAVAKGTLQGLSKLGPDDAVPGTVSLTDASAKTHTFEGRASRVEWGDLAADLVLLTPPPGEPAPAVEALRLHLEARERRLEETSTALDLAADGVVTLDRTARLLSLNRSAERLFGHSANEVVGDSLTALIEPRDHRAALACLDLLRTGTSGAVQRCEVRGRTRGGGSIPLSMRAGHMPGEEPGFAVAFEDITHFRVMEDELRDARASAEEASANRAEFLARISHEVRTPLTAITGFAELMLDERFGPLGNERYKGYIRDMRDSGVHVISLVNDLLDLAKATSGTDELHPGPLDLNAVVQQCVALTGPLAGQEKTIIRTSFPPDLPRVHADERSVRQIVINLLSNAIRFTEAGGQVIVSTASGGRGEVVLSVRDTGPGMSEEEVETALTPFRQVPKTRRGDGTGLGLPLSKALTEANGGVFVITSARDLGTLVEVRLPAERRNAVAAE